MTWKYITNLISYLIRFVFSVLSQNDGKGKEDVRSVPTLGHQPVVLGGFYSAIEDEFLPGK